MLKTRAEAAARAAEQAEAAGERAADAAQAGAREFRNARRYAPADAAPPSPARRDRDSFGEPLARNLARELTGTTGRRIVRGILGGLFKAR